MREIITIRYHPCYFVLVTVTFDLFSPLSCTLKWFLYLKFLLCFVQLMATVYLTENKIQIWWKGKYSWVNAEQTRDQACLNLFYRVDHTTINCSHPLIYELRLNIRYIFSCLMMHVIRISIILSKKQMLIRKRKFILEIDLKSRSNIIWYQPLITI